MTPDKFSEINWDAPFDLPGYLNAVPSSATIKGIFFRDLIGQVIKVGGKLALKEDYSGFKDYPMRDYMNLLVEAGKIIHPRHSTRRALRQLGRSVFPTFVESLVGRVMVGVMKTDVLSIIKIANKTAAAAMSVGTVDTLKAVPGEAVLHFKDVYFSDTYQVGVFEGTMEATKKRSPRILLYTKSISDVTMQILWQD